MQYVVYYCVMDKKTGRGADKLSAAGRFSMYIF